MTATKNKLAYSVSELAEVLGIGRNTAYELVNQRNFPSIRVNERRIIVPIDGLRTWLANQAEDKV